MLANSYKHVFQASLFRWKLRFIFAKKLVLFSQLPSSQTSSIKFNVCWVSSCTLWPFVSASRQRLMQLFLKLLFLGNFLPRGTMPLFAHKAQCLDCVEECGLVHNFIAIQWHLRSVSLYGQNLNLELVGWPRHLLSDQVGWLPKKKAHLKFV